MGHVLGDLGVGEDQEAFVGERLDHGIGDGAGFDHAVGDHVGHRRIVPLGHRRADGLRAERGHPDACVVVGDGQPLREPDRGVLRDRVGRGAEVGEQPGGRRGGDHVAGASFGPARNEVSGRPDVVHDVDVPDALPLLVGHLRAARMAADTGVRDEQIDRSVFGFGGLDERLDRGLARDVGDDRRRADLGGGGGQRIGRHIGDDDVGCTLGDEPLGQRPSDAVGSTGDHADCILDQHCRNSS